MPLHDAVSQVSKAVKDAQDQAAKAYDELLAELEKDPPATDQVIKHSGAVWTASAKAVANLWLAPAKIAQAVVSDG